MPQLTSYCIPDSAEALMRELIDWYREGKWLSEVDPPLSEYKPEGTACSTESLVGDLSAEEALLCLAYPTVSTISFFDKSLVQSSKELGTLSLYDWVWGAVERYGLTVVHTLSYYLIVIDEASPAGRACLRVFRERMSKSSTSTITIGRDRSIENLQGIGLEHGRNNLVAMARVWFGDLDKTLLVGDPEDGMAFLLLERDPTPGEFVCLETFKVRRCGALSVYERFPDYALRAMAVDHSASYLCTLVPREADLDALRAIWDLAASEDGWTAASLEQLKTAVEQFMIFDIPVGPDRSMAVLWQKTPRPSVVEQVAEMGDIISVF